MRIALITQSCDDRTGLGRIVLALSREYAARGHEVDVVAQTATGLEGVATWHRVPGMPWRNALHKLAFRLAEPRVTRSLPPALLHAFGIGREADIVSAQSCHAAGMELRASSQTGRILKRNFGIYDRLSLSDERRLARSARTRCIVAVSDLVSRQFMQYYGIDSQKIRVVPNGVDLKAIRRWGTPERRATDRAAMGISLTTPVLLFVGNEFERKGLQTAIEALSLISPFQPLLLVAGNDDPAPYARLAAALGVADRVRFLGAVAGAERLLGISDCFVFPTTYEAFGIVILEAMAAGVPVITSAAAGVAEGLHDGVHGLFMTDPLSSYELAEKITLILHDSELRERIVPAARQHAEQLPWSEVANRLLTIYQDV